MWACDFLQVYDVWFRPLFPFLVIDIKSREVIHVGVTRAPSEQWTAQQLRTYPMLPVSLREPEHGALTPFGEGPQVIIRDRDSKFGAQFDRVAKGAGIKVVRTAVRAPLMNARCERFSQALSREPCRIPLSVEPHGEAIAFTAEGDGYITVSEGSRPPLSFYRRAR